jgi:outer membrane protein assembly factor BamA
MRARLLRRAPQAISALGAFFLLLAYFPGSSRAAPKAAGSSLTRVEIERVELVGVREVERGALTAVLEVAPGDLLERIRVVRTVENIQELYRVKGYEQARVQAELVREKSDSGELQAVLKFIVDEGLPVRIASVKLVQSRPPSAEKGQVGGVEEKAYIWWRERQTELLESLAIKFGSTLDQETLTAGKRKVQDVLASEEWVGSRVDQIRMKDATISGRADLSAFPASRWVDLEYEVELGDRVTFGFRGNEQFERSRLLKLIDEQRALGLGKNYIESLKARILDAYRALGWSLVDVQALTFEKPSGFERHVTFLIEEGPRVPLKNIRFDGVQDFSAEQLKKQFLSRSGDMTQQGWFVEKELEQAAEAMVTWMRSQGYLSAKTVALTRKWVRNPARREVAVDVTVWLYEGGQTRVQKVELVGMARFPREELLEILGLSKVDEEEAKVEGAPLDLAAFNRGIEAIRERYKAEGWLDFRFLNEGESSVVQYGRENRVATIKLEAEEGVRWQFGEIEIVTASGIPPEIIRRELTFVPGDPVRDSDLRDSEAAIRRLGIFSGVDLALVDDPDHPTSRKKVRVTLEEGTPGILAGGVGYRNDLGARAFGQLGYTNLWNRNHTVAFNANVNRRFDESFCTTPAEAILTPDQPHCFLEFQAQLGYVWPWFALGRTTFRPRFTIERTQYRNFDADTISLASTWERRLLDRFNLIGTLTYSLERTQQYNAETVEDNQDLTIGSLTPGLRLDLRDSPLAPTRGWFIATSFEWASPALLSQVDPFPVGYTRFQGRVDRYISLGAQTSLFLSFRTGFARNLQSPPADNPDDARYAIPLIKQFSLGGASSLRGFADQEINVQDLAIRGTLSYVNYRAQIDLPFAGAMRFGPFLDAGNLLVDEFSFGQLRYGSGFGFHYQSPVGPVNFDLGFKLDRKPNEGPFQFYFSIGVI